MKNNQLSGITQKGSCAEHYSKGELCRAFEKRIKVADSCHEELKTAGPYWYLVKSLELRS